MNILVDWDDSQTHKTIRYDFIGMWEWFDFSQASTQAFHMMAEVPHEVNVIFDLRLSLDVPSGAFRAIHRLLQFAPENMDIIVIASEDKLTQQIFAMLLKLDKDLRRQITFAKTLEDARVLLQQYHAQQVG